MNLSLQDEKMLPLASGDDAAAVMWLDISSQNAKYANLYASHKVLVETARDRAVTKRSVAADRRSGVREGSEE